MDTDKDTDEDESDQSIARSFDEATTDLKNEDDIKPSANDKEVS